MGGGYLSMLTGVSVVVGLSIAGLGWAEGAEVPTDTEGSEASATSSASAARDGSARMDEAGASRVRVAASSRYRAGRVHRFVLGGGYRDLWETPVELPVLDLKTEAGGLVPTRRFGGLQTAVLGFTGRDGRAYSFRGTDKDPSAVVHPLLRETVVRTLVQDQMAAQHPAGPVVASVLARAAGIATIEQRLVVMPDDPALGSFREEFAGMVGSFYEYPTPARGAYPGYRGAREIIDQKELYTRLRAGLGDRVDVKAFLRARLFDLLLGDFDRHKKQWRWARFPGSSAWHPIPEDRDQAFVRYDGVMQRIGSLFVPILQNYGGDYPSMRGLAFHGWEQDRHLLAALSWPTYAAVAGDLRARLTDAVIDEAIAEMPPEYVEIDGDRLRRDLRGRRDRLLEAARSFYAHLADRVDVQASDAPETVSVAQSDEGFVTLTVSSRTATTATPTTAADGVVTFARRFDPGETREVRVYLHGGEDTVDIAGPPGPICVRIVAGEGKKHIDDRQGGDAQIYAEEADLDLMPGSGTAVTKRPYTPPSSNAGFLDVENIPPRDWGSDTFPLLAIGHAPDLGLFFGGGAVHQRYAFRKHPFADRHRIIAGWATAANRPRLHYTGTFRRENSELAFALDVRLSGLEVLRFYGFGNETRASGSPDRFRVRNQLYRIAPSVSYPLVQDRLTISGGGWVEYSVTESGERLIDELRPYGSGRFGSTGLSGRLRFDTRASLSDLNRDLALPFDDNIAAGYPTRGLLLELEGHIGPPLWDVEAFWGSVEGSLAGFLRFGPRSMFVVALRVGGKQTFGQTPYYNAAFLGGGQLLGGTATIRGFRAQRFAGDTAVYANADLRVALLRLKVLLPGELGVLGFADIGRVFEDQPTSGWGSLSARWHASAGGGIWFAPLTRTNTFSLSAAHSSEETLFLYLRAGFHY